LSFSATSSADNLELDIDNNGTADATDDKTIQIVEPLSISSAANQTFTVGDPTTAISMITVTDDGAAATVTAADDIRIRIPATFNMTWDTSDTTATIGGGAAAKVSATVSYPDSRTLLVDVTSDFSNADSITISGLSFTAFSATSAVDNLELDTNNDAAADATDDKTIQIVGPLSISSAANQTFRVGDPTTAISTITVTDNEGAATITAANDIRIRIPATFNMTWDTSDTAATIGGGAAGKVSSTVSYPDSRTLLVDVTSDFSPADSITISGLSFTSFSAVSSADNLELDIDNNGTADATDDKTIQIVDPVLISSAANQTFTVGDPDTAISTMTVTDDGAAATISAANDIRIRIPATFNMTWDTADTTAVIGGGAAGKVSATVSYPDSRTLLVDVTADFLAGESITISGLSFSSFTALSAADNLELDTTNDAGADATDDKTVQIFGPLSISSAANQTFSVGDAATPISTITLTDNGVSATITAAGDIRIRIPATFNMIWDTSDTAAAIGGGAAAKVSATVSYPDSRTLLVDVTSDFSAADSITISGLNFTSFSAGSTADNLELDVDNDGTADATDDKTVQIDASLALSSAGNQTFTEGDPSTAISTITVTDGFPTPSITAANDIRIQIPAGFNMVWDTSDTTAVIAGGASSKVATTVTYEGTGSVLVLDVTSDFAAEDSITVSGLSFTTFSAASPADNLELDIDNNGAADATDDKTIEINAAPALAVNYRSIGTAVGTLYSTGDASISAGGSTVTFAGGAVLPTNVGLGDELVVGAETMYILSRDSTTQVTIQGTASSTHSNAAYTISRAYNTFSAWETARQGDLVAEDRREVGVAYNDGEFTPTTTFYISGSTTDSTHYMELTVAEGQRHDGTAGTGVVVNAIGVSGDIFALDDEYTVIEWLGRTLPGGRDDPEHDHLRWSERDQVL
jgi:hypothetical protein